MNMNNFLQALCWSMNRPALWSCKSQLLTKTEPFPSTGDKSALSSTPTLISSSSPGLLPSSLVFAQKLIHFSCKLSFSPYRSLILVKSSFLLQTLSFSPQLTHLAQNFTHSANKLTQIHSFGSQNHLFISAAC